MLERHNRRQRRHLGRAAEDVRAVDDVALHDLEFFCREPVRLIEYFERGVHLADVVHQRREAELPQQGPVDIERAHLRHGERRDVHHVRERVVVVFLDRRQRHQRRAVLRDEPGEAVDDLPRRIGVGLVARLGRLPERFGRLDRGVVHPSGRRNPHLIVCDVLDDNFPDLDVPDAAHRQPIGDSYPRLAIAQDRDEAADVLARQAARQRDFLDLARTKVPSEADQRHRSARQSPAVDHDFVADESDDDARRRLECLEGVVAERVDAVLYQRMGRRVQLGPAQGCGETSHEIFGFPLVHF